MALVYQQNQAQLIDMQLLETVRQLSGASNNFVGETVILNSLHGGLGADSLRNHLTSLVKASRLECFVPVTSLGSCAPCGSCCAPCGTGCGCASDCCGGGCCGCGRYYRVKIG